MIDDLHGNRKFVLQVFVIKLKVTPDSCAPVVFPVKIYVSPMFVFVSTLLRLFVTLEPFELLLVVSPRLSLQLASSKVLLIASLLAVKTEVQGIQVEFFKKCWVLEFGRWLLGKRSWDWAWCAGLVPARLVELKWFRHEVIRYCQLLEP